jgi:arsenite oxidase small subunit
MPPAGPQQTGPERWRAEFPYRWDADELVGRRELLRLAVLASGALFAGTAVLAILGRAVGRKQTAPREIALASAVPLGQAYYFSYPGTEDQAVLLHLPSGQFVAYSQKCTHLSCSVYYQVGRRRLYCPCHEGVFDPVTGEPIAGPPRRRLPRVNLQQEGDTLIAIGVTP